MNRRDLLVGAGCFALAGCGSGGGSSSSSPVTVAPTPTPTPAPAPAPTPEPAPAPTPTPAPPPANEVVVDGTTVASIQAAIDSIHDASAQKRYRILLPARAQAYEARNVIWKDYVDLIGQGDVPVLVTCELPDDTRPADIGANSALFVYHEAAFVNLHVRGRNCRYPMHVDGDQIAGKTIVTDGCVFEHLGNEGARDYQRSIGNDPTVFGTPEFVWSSVCAWGSGTRAGTTFAHKNTRFVSPDQPYLVHDSVDPQSAGSFVTFEGGSIVSDKGAAGQSLLAQSYGSGIDSSITIDGTSFVGKAANAVVAGGRRNWVITVANSPTYVLG